MHVYREFVNGVFTVGFYDPAGEWHEIKDFERQEEAAYMVHFLNGGNHRSPGGYGPYHILRQPSTAFQEGKVTNANRP